MGGGPATFYPFQWDLNYANSQVFLHMVKALPAVIDLVLKSISPRFNGLPVEAFRNKLRKIKSRAHWILQALRDIVSIAAPAILLKAEGHRV